MSVVNNIATQAVRKSVSPSRAFFRVSENISSIQQARAVFKTLGSYGEMVEYKVLRVSLDQKKYFM